MRPFLPLLLLLPLFAYLHYRTTQLEARLDGLERSQRRAATQGGGAVAATPPGTQPAAGAVAAGPGAGAGTAELQALRADVTAMRAELDKVREVARPEEILGLVKEEEERLRNVAVDFHRERWIELREDTLDELATQAGFTDFQRTQVGDLMNAEVDKIAELARQPHVFEDPEKLANDVMQILDETEDRVRVLLNREQRPIWEQRRAFERKTVYPWLPR